MGLFSFLKNKFSKKEEAKSEELSSYEKGLEKSRKNFASRLDALSKRYAKADGEYFEELETILIESDVGVGLSIRLIEQLMEEADNDGVTDPKTINEKLVDAMFVDYATKGDSIENEIRFAKVGPTVLLVCGVNGVGKTTSIAKLAYRYKNQGKKVALVAGDTFRAGAVEQLGVWADRLGIPLIKGKENGDPASVAFDGAKFAVENKIDLLIVDTAGRLQNKTNLMQELAKISRVLSKEIPEAPHETFLIIDATTGQNALRQAELFSQTANITGIVLTKLDGTAKGGMIIGIKEQLNIPVKWVGVGERLDDLRPFNAKEFADALFN